LIFQIVKSNQIKLSEYFICISRDSHTTAYSAIDEISFIADFGIRREKSDSTFAGILNSAILKESVHTNTSFLVSHSDLVLINTHVSTGEKFFSVIVYSTILTPSMKVFVSILTFVVFTSSGKATYSLADIQLIVKSSSAEVICITLFCIFTEISIVFSSIVLSKSKNILAFTVIAHSNFMSHGISISTYFSISVALIFRVSILAFI